MIPAFSPRSTAIAGLVAVLTFNSPKTVCAQAAAGSADKSAQMDRGRQLYLKNCFVCHQLNGQGTPGAFPPLAQSDFLAADKERAVRVLCEGVSGEITVNGKKFDSIMPPVVLGDSDVADVLTYVRNAWGNSGEALDAGEVKTVRAKTSFPTLESLQAANDFAPLPKPPEEFTLREVVRMPNHGVRMASDGKGRVIYVLCENGDVYRLETASGQLRQILWAKRYLEHLPGDAGGPLFVVGLALDKENHLYISSNQPNNAKAPFQNRVTIYRTTSVQDGDPADPKPWLDTSYPGNSAYVHGLGHIAFGPDGFLYAGNGARTDANQAGTDTNYYQGGETPITSCIWRLGPRAEKPEIEVFARGIRNAYGFCWNDKGEMFATENGPDADAPEELNLIERGKHYGFPYQFSNWTKKAYPHTPDPPPGLKFTLPIANLGPDGGFDGTPLYTFDPHSSPGGIVFLGNDFPPAYRGTFFLTRFGNFIRTPKDNVGYDLLQARLQKNANGIYEAQIKTILKPLGRPIDLHLSGQGKIYICEYSRPTNNMASYSLPGRILELEVKPPAP
ncbi:MAG TPA: PQQ-dependent sugar dehydrogenase [Verrucomicrobiae bacterium]|nr:PQQ-dependent sugar dehydrogenase [Verrucomicrobiae bacterium]